MFFLKDILFPKFCLGCGFLGSYICFNCRKKLIKAQEESCFYCHRTSYQGLTHRNCFRKNGVDGFIYIYIYNNLLKKIIKTTKYRYVKESFSELLLDSYFAMFDKLIFYKRTLRPLSVEEIPLHEVRLKRRGFNQSKIIKDFLKDQFSLEETSYLKKVKETRPQAMLKKVERVNNLKGVFSSTKILKATNILLIDDVVTTGATMAEAAKVLKAQGAAAVIAFALAKG